MTTAGAQTGVAIRRAEPGSLYVNYFEVAHNPYEFLIELGQFRPSNLEGDGDIVIHTCVALSPPYAKMLSRLLSHSVTEYEAENGALPAIGETGSAFDIILRSLPDEFEDRARELRSRSNGSSARRSSQTKKQR